MGTHKRWFKVFIEQEFLINFCKIIYIKTLKLELKSFEIFGHFLKLKNIIKLFVIYLLICE